MLCKLSIMLRYMRSLEEVDQSTVLDIVGNLASLPHRRGSGDGRLFELGVYQDVGDALDFFLSSFHDGYIDRHGSAGGGHLIPSSADRELITDVIDDLFGMEIIEVQEGGSDGASYTIEEENKKVFVFSMYLSKFVDRYCIIDNNMTIELKDLIQLTSSLEDGIYIPLTVSFYMMKSGIRFRQSID